jgi:hypothetical protein
MKQSGECLPFRDERVTPSGGSLSLWGYAEKRIVPKAMPRCPEVCRKRNGLAFTAFDIWFGPLRD